MIVTSEQVNQIASKLFVVCPLSDEILAAGYLLMKGDNLLETVYYQKVPSLLEYLQWHHNPTNQYLGGFVHVEGEDKPALAGLGWLSQIQGEEGARKGEVGFVFFHEYQRDGIPWELTAQMIDYCYGPLGMNLLCGTTPIANRRALAFSRTLGFRHLEPIPDFCTYQGTPSPAVISYLTKGMWEDHLKHKRKERTPDEESDPDGRAFD